MTTMERGGGITKAKRCPTCMHPGQGVGPDHHQSHCLITILSSIDLGGKILLLNPHGDANTLPSGPHVGDLGILNVSIECILISLLQDHGLSYLLGHFP